MVAHSAESSQSVKMGLKAPYGWRSGTNPRVTSSIAAQWLTPTISALLLLSANVQHSRLYQSDKETCLPSTNILPISVETAQLCAQQEDFSNYITSIMNNPNYLVIHNQAAINTYNEETLNNTVSITNETSKIVDKIYNILLGSLKSTNQSLEMKNYDLPFSYIVSKLHNRTSVNQNRSAFQQFSSMKDEPEENYNNEEDDQTYYSTSNEDYGNKDTLIYEYPSYKVSDADVSAATETLYHDLNTDEVVTDESATDFMPSTHDQQNQQFKHSTETADTAEISYILNSSSPSQASQQTEINFPTVQFKISPTTSQSLLTANNISATSTTEESIMPVTAGLESNNYLSLLNTETEAIPQTSTAGEELVTTYNEFTFQQQINRITESAIESQTTPSLKSSTGSEITPQSEGGVIHVQIPETVNLCVVKCYFSGSFLKKYLFALLFLCYFVPVLASVMICVTTDKNLAMIQSHEVEPNEEQPTTTNQNNATETACNMHLARMVSTC
jgi:hypothetical protein